MAVLYCIRIRQLNKRVLIKSPHISAEARYGGEARTLPVVHLHERRACAVPALSVSWRRAECAAYVAGLVEVKASRGFTSGKQEVLQVYKVRYSHRRSFHEELRMFEMA